MNFLLEVTDYTKPIDGLWDKIAFGGQMVLIGMSVVFSVLLTLWLSLYLFKVFFHDIPSGRKLKTKEIKVAEAAPMVPTTVQSASDEEIVAVIAAAIAAAESENTGLKFRVVSFKRK